MSFVLASPPSSPTDEKLIIIIIIIIRLHAYCLKRVTMLDRHIPEGAISSLMFRKNNCWPPYSILLNDCDKASMASGKGMLLIVTSYIDVIQRM